jgi:DNA-binding LytR/AlgR family response regulator
VVLHPAGAATPESAVPLMSRLPPELQDDRIVSISMQDHYARVTTTSGSALILMRLSDAMDLLDGCPGARIHRSHWVAKGFAESIGKSGRRMELRLTDGRALPVGASYLKAAERQLYLPGPVRTGGADG